MNILALDLGTKTGWALRTQRRSYAIKLSDVNSGEQSFAPQRFEGGGMRYLRFERWLDALAQDGLGAVYFEEVRRHAGVTAAHTYGGFLATLTRWCESRAVPYSGVPVGTIKKHATGKGNAGKPVVIAAMRMRGHALSKDSDNEADALALLYWALEENHDEAAGDTDKRPAPDREPRGRAQVGAVPVARARVRV